MSNFLSLFFFVIVGFVTGFAVRIIRQFFSDTHYFYNVGVRTAVISENPFIKYGTVVGGMAILGYVIFRINANAENSSIWLNIFFSLASCFAGIWIGKLAHYDYWENISNFRISGQNWQFDDVAIANYTLKRLNRITFGLLFIACVLAIAQLLLMPDSFRIIEVYLLAGLLLIYFLWIPLDQSARRKELLRKNQDRFQ